VLRKDKKHIDQFNSDSSIACKELLPISFGKKISVYFTNCMYNDYNSDEE